MNTQKSLNWQKYLTREYSFLYISYAIDCYKIMGKTVGTTITYDISQGEGKLVSLYGIMEDIQNSYSMIEKIAEKDPQEIVRKMDTFDSLIQRNYELFKLIKNTTEKKELRKLLEELDQLFLETLCYYLFFVFLGYAGDLPHIKKFLKKHGERFHKIRLYTIDADMDKQFPKLFGKYDKKLETIASYMWRKELVDYIHNKPIDLTKIKNRKKKYLVITKAGETTEHNISDIKKVLGKELSHLTHKNDQMQVKGHSIYKGTVSGQVIIIRTTKDYKKITPSQIIIASMIKPSIIPYLKNIGGIITDDGGQYSHAAIIAKKLHIPCIVGTENASNIFKNSDSIILNATKGIATKQIDVKGRIAFKGKVAGRVKIVFTEKDYKKIKEGDILVTPMTKPSIVPYLSRVTAIVTNDNTPYVKNIVKGIVTDDGGALSHASIISREMKIPCIVGTGNATSILKDGELIEVDADNGIVKML